MNQQYVMQATLYTQPYTVAPKRFNHKRHLIASLLTFGLWIPFYMAIWFVSASVSLMRRIYQQRGSRTVKFNSPKPTPGYSETNPHAQPYPQYMPPPAQHAATKRIPAWSWVVSVVGVLIGLVAIFGANTDPAQKATVGGGLPNVVSTPTPEPVVTPSAKVTPIAPRTKEVAPPAKPKLSISQQQAVKSAERYVDILPFSRKGLIHQLKYEGFTAAEVTYAADHIGANWTVEADQAAASYLSVMSFSHATLLRQLMFDGFTKAQALHGVKSVGL